MKLEKVFNFEAKVENLSLLNEYLEEILASENVDIKTIFSIEVPLEEIFVNICLYAYTLGTGDIQVTIILDNNTLKMILKDSGVPYNPLEKEDPDISSPAEEREIGGLGIFMAKNMLDEILYNYQNGENINTLIKYLE